MVSPQTGDGGVGWGIAIPQRVGAGFDVTALVAYLQRAEALGFESAWTVEQVIGTTPHLGVAETLAVAATATRRMRLGCSVFVSPLHTPVHLAKSVATLDRLSAGRIEVGLAAGGRSRPFAAFGITGDHLVSRFEEGLTVMRALWAQETVTFDGRFWQLDAVPMEPKPVQRPGPPIWIGGGAPAAVRRAVRLADGFFGAGSQTTEAFAAQAGVVREALAETGRDPASFGVAKRVYLAVDDDWARARETVSEGLADFYRYYGRADLTPVGVFGTPEQCAEGLRAVVDAGARRVLLHPFGADPEHLDRLAAEVIPLV